MAICNPVCPSLIPQDPIKTAQGSLSLKAYRLTPKLMEICKEKDFTPEGWVALAEHGESDAVKDFMFTVKSDKVQIFKYCFLEYILNITPLISWVEIESTHPCFFFFNDVHWDKYRSIYPQGRMLITFTGWCWWFINSPRSSNKCTVFTFSLTSRLIVIALKLLLKMIVMGGLFSQRYGAIQLCKLSHAIACRGTHAK